MFGNPGSLTMYSTAQRSGMVDPNAMSAGPADYTVTTGSIKKRNEMVAPFDTTAKRTMYQFTFSPGPAAYSPDKPPRDSRGSPLMMPDHFPENLRRGYRSNGPGPAYKIMDQFDKMALDMKAMATKGPRASFEKFVSNCCPTVYHPQDIRCFVEGVDGRMYPWKINRNTKTPGPKYNTYGVETSSSRRVPKIDFSNGSKRPPLFRTEPGFGPADFTVSRSLNIKGGIMLSKTSDPKKSDMRYFDSMNRRTIRDHIPHPFSYYIPSSFDNFSSKAVSAPFKSKTKQSITVKPKEGPGPAAYFKREIKPEQITDPKIFGICTIPPDSIKSFNTTEPRFFTMDNNEQEHRPDPCAYNIRGFAEELQDNLVKHRPAFRNPKMGFLVSAEARPASVFRHLFGEPLIVSRSSPRRPWRNIRPRKGDTYPYHGPPLKYADSPGPIYDTNPAYAAIKAKKSWNDPRRWLHSTAFLVSGCARDIKLSITDKDVPGPGKYYPKLPAMSGGKLSKSRTRFPRSDSVGPGPSHKFHEKMDSSVWRASHLGTFNTKLKQIGISHPNAGGFRAKVMDKAADKAWRIQREDDYEEALSNPKETKCMESILKVKRHES